MENIGLWLQIYHTILVTDFQCVQQSFFFFSTAFLGCDFSFTNHSQVTKK